MRVDFPAPFSPTNPWTSTALTLKLTPFRAWTPGKLLWMSVMETMVALECSAMLLIPDRKEKNRSPPSASACTRLLGRVARTYLALLRLPLEAGGIQGNEGFLVVHGVPGT